MTLSDDGGDVDKHNNDLTMIIIKPNYNTKLTINKKEGKLIKMSQLSLHSKMIQHSCSNNLTFSLQRVKLKVKRSD